VVIEGTKQNRRKQTDWKNESREAFNTLSFQAATETCCKSMKQVRCFVTCKRRHCGRHAGGGNCSNISDFSQFYAVFGKDAMFGTPRLHGTPPPQPAFPRSIMNVSTAPVRCCSLLDVQASSAQLWFSASFPLVQKLCTFPFPVVHVQY
jgi:hypothetical protein